MKIAVAGSRTFNLTPAMGHVIIRELKELDDNWGTVLLRRPRGNIPEPFERMVASIAEKMEFEVEWCAPTMGGRAATYLRDVHMVSKASRVLAFFPEGEEMTGGTAHLVEKALDQNIPVTAYAMTPEGKLRWVGGTDVSEAQ